MKRLLLIIALFLFCLVPTLAQDATAESTAPVLPTDTIAVISGEGEGDTIVNVGGETPAESDPTETPAEPMPWWAQASIWIAGLVTIYATITQAVKVGAQAFMARPNLVSAAEAGFKMLPDQIENAIKAGIQRGVEETKAAAAEVNRVYQEIIDNTPYITKQQTPPDNSSVSSTGGTFDSSAPRMP